MKALNMQNSRLTTKLRSALGFESLAFVYAFLLAGQNIVTNPITGP